MLSKRCFCSASKYTLPICMVAQAFVLGKSDPCLRGTHTGEQIRRRICRIESIGQVLTQTAIFLRLVSLGYSIN